MREAGWQTSNDTPFFTYPSSLLMPTSVSPLRNLITGVTERAREGDEMKRGALKYSFSSLPILTLSLVLQYDLSRPRQLLT